MKNTAMKKSMILMAAVVLLAACGAPDKKAQLEKKKQEYAALGEEIKTLEAELGDSAVEKTGNQRIVAVTEMKSETFTHYVDVQGNIDAGENVNVSARSMGTIVKVNTSVGQKVSKGQILAEIDNAVLVAGIEELRVSLNFATEMFKKQESLYNRKIGTEIQYLTAKNNKESLEKRMASMQQQLEMTYIKSPINGTVDAVDIKVGSSVMPGLPCIRVVNFADMKLIASIAESQSGRVKAGDKVIIHFPDIDKDVTSKLTYVSRVINPSSRTFDVEAKLTSVDEYRPNMVGIMKIADYEKQNALVVPINAVQQSEEGSSVYVAETKDGKTVARKVIVKTGQTYGGRVEVLSGLKAGDKVITVGFQDLNDGDEIKL